MDEIFEKEDRVDGWVLYILKDRDMRARVRHLNPAAEMGLHSTEGWEEFIHIIGGSGEVFTRPPRNRGQWKPVERGWSFYLHKNTEHCLKASEDGMTYLAVVVRDGFCWRDEKRTTLGDVLKNLKSYIKERI